MPFTLRVPPFTFTEVPASPMVIAYASRALGGELEETRELLGQKAAHAIG